MADSVEVAAAKTRNGRDFLEARVTERAARNTAEQVQETCSFARAERLLGREYHGRFLIELLQNAADAWREQQADGQRSKVRVEVAEGPTLLVANQGNAFPAAAVIESLGHIGRSTKAHGEAIGHKGIGFKSVLEVSLRPELYSGLREAEPTLAVRFDPREALAVIRSHSPEWDAHLAQVEDIDDPAAAVPVLRYPTWVDELPRDVQALASARFDTVIRLPFDDAVRPDPNLDADTWLAVVRDALDDITDQMLLLLGTFDRLEVVDRLADERCVIEPQWRDETALEDGSTRELVRVVRNDSPMSRWRLYRRTLPDAQGLSGEIAVGLRGHTEDGSLLPAVAGAASAPFHLFFPTKIGSGLPFLLHGYFEVNAARTGFYDGSAAQNDAILGALADLVARAVGDTAEDDGAALTSLADLLGAGAALEEPRAQAFRDRALRLLDNVPWVPIEPGPDVPDRALPTELLVDDRSETIDRIVASFSPGYIRRQTRLSVPSRRIGESGHRYLMKRRAASAPDLWDSLELLFRPGPGGPWDQGEEDTRFISLLDLVAALLVHDGARARQLLEAARGDPHSHLLPALATDGGRTLLPLPDPSEATAGRRSKLVMARARDMGGRPIVPPESMDVAFLPDGLLDSEAQVDSAKPLGVRDFTVDNVLDRMGGVASSEANPEAVLEFLWALLVRERRSDFSTAAAGERAAEFAPSSWFWCRPGEGAMSATEVERQRRRRLLTQTRLPTRDGTWRPAGELAFGAEWAQWLEAGRCGPLTTATRLRAKTYTALEAVSPRDDSLLAPPDVVLTHLRDEAFGERGSDDDALRNRERHAFLLGLGVWEVIPVEAFESRETRHRERFPWSGALVDLRAERVTAAGGWEFTRHPWSGRGHQKAWIAEDFRFRWSLPEAAARDATQTAHLLSAGAHLYSRLGRAAAFCPSCTSNGSWHTRRYSSSPEDDYPSVLALELQTDPWVPAVLNGESMDEPQVASKVWWAEKPPAGAGLQRSPLRYLMLADPAVQLASLLRSLARIPGLEAADLEQIASLLGELRRGFDRAALVISPDSSTSAKQAFIGLHRLAYERLDELASTKPAVASELLSGFGVLCEVGDALEFISPPAATRHDDGRFAAYRRYFSGRIPFAALPRDRPQIANRLGIPPFVVSLERRPTTSSRDVTDEVADILAERVPELLAIVVHHSLGTQTLEPTSQQFEERSRRLRNLRVCQVDDLVIDASVVDTDAAATIGEGSGQDVYLEGATTAHPVLYHDLLGTDWKDALRRKLHPHLAAVLENPAYAATFKNLLLADDDAEREELLHELGISTDDVGGIRSAIGAVSEEERARQHRWYSAIVATVSGSAEVPALDLEHVTEALVEAGLSSDVAHRLVDAGGGQAARSDVTPDGPLSLLAANDISLEQLDRRLRDRDAFDGLSVDVAQRRLTAWSRRNRRRVAALLAQRRPADEAKAIPDAWKAPTALRLVLDPGPAQWLAPVIDSLQAAGFDADPVALADDSLAELVRIGQLAGTDDLEALARRLYDREEQERILRASGAAWRAELALLGIIVRTRQGESRAAIRAQADTVDDLLPVGPSAPAALVPTLDALFGIHSALAQAIAGLMTDTLSSIPERASLLALAAAHGVDTAHYDRVERALQGPKRDLARRLRGHIAALEAEALRPRLPDGLKAATRTPRPDGGLKTVPAVKVNPTSDARKRRVGDDGERWALAAVLAPMVPLGGTERRTAVDGVVALLKSFSGSPVEKALAHAEPACEPELDDDELIDELTELLHVSRHSDGFGFDLLGWLPPVPGAEPIAMCIEVKSTRDGKFHLSRGEWQRATWFNDRGEGERYALLVVHRSAGDGPPKRLDLLADPVELVKTGQLAKTDDGYELGYATR